MKQDKRLEAIRERQRQLAHYPHKPDDPTCYWCCINYLLTLLDEKRDVRENNNLRVALEKWKQWHKTAPTNRG